MKIYIETFGCQMNLNDTEILSSILTNSGYKIEKNIDHADIIFMNTCSVRDNAEKRVLEKIKQYGYRKRQKPKLMIGILGCMAERLKEDLMTKNEQVDLVVGPDEYRKLPFIITQAAEHQKPIAVNLSTVETYEDITPLHSKGISAWLSIMRGCNNFCSYCVVPYTRGRERSRPGESIISELKEIAESYKEVTFLGQNVNSYFDKSNNWDFADLLDNAATLFPALRIRFTTSHPKDINMKVIDVIKKHSNLCKHIHLPLQAGSNRILDLMNRKYTIEHYLKMIESIRAAIPDISLTTDLIAGYPSENDEDHNATLEALKKIQFDGAYMFRYSPREGTKAFELPDDVPENIKLKRLNEIINLQQQISYERNKNEIGKIHQILVEGKSKKNKDEWQGRSDTNKVAVFKYKEGIKVGDMVNVKITAFTSATLIGELI